MLTAGSSCRRTWPWWGRGTWYAGDAEADSTGRLIGGAVSVLQNSEYMCANKYLPLMFGIPYLSIVQRLSYKCETEGIIFKTSYESYTSGTSFLDGEQPVKENYDKSRRVYRGIFVTKEGRRINADVVIRS